MDRQENVLFRSQIRGWALKPAKNPIRFSKCKQSVTRGQTAPTAITRARVTPKGQERERGCPPPFIGSSPSCSPDRISIIGKKSAAFLGVFILRAGKEQLMFLWSAIYQPPTFHFPPLSLSSPSPPTPSPGVFGLLLA